MALRRLIKLNKTGSVCIIIPKTIAEALNWDAGIKLDIKLGKDRTIIISEFKDGQENKCE